MTKGYKPFAEILRLDQTHRELFLELRKQDNEINQLRSERDAARDEQLRMLNVIRDTRALLAEWVAWGKSVKAAWPWQTAVEADMPPMPKEKVEK